MKNNLRDRHHPLNACFQLALIVLIVISCGPFTFSHASSLPPKLFPGYIIEKNGDTVLCNIQFKDWNRNPTSIVVEIRGVTTNLGASDIKGFGVTGYAEYKSAKLSYHLDPISAFNPPDHYSNQIQTMDHFLKIEVIGPYSLYELILPERFYYFIGGTDSVINELVYRVKQVDLTIEEDQSFKNYFSELFTKEGIAAENSQSIKSANYILQDIRRLVNRLNEHRTGKITPKVKTGGSSVELEAFFGITLHKFPSNFDGKFLPAARMSSVTTITGGIGMLYLIPGHFKSLAIGLSVSYDVYKQSTGASGSAPGSESVNFYWTTKYNEQISMAHMQTMTDLYAIYIFRPLRRLRPYIKGGISENILIGNNYFYDNYTYNTSGIRNGVVPFTDSGAVKLNLRSFTDASTNLSVAAGIMVDRQKLELVAYKPVSVTASSEPAFKVIAFGVRYRYTLIK